jgi:hypothetical protein
MPNYLFASTEQPEVPTRQDPVDDGFLFRQAPARGLGKVTFADWRRAFEPFAGLPNVAQFREQAEGFTTFATDRGAGRRATGGPRLPLALGQLFTLITYAQLILEQVKLTGLDLDVSTQSSRSSSGISRFSRSSCTARRPPRRRNSSGRWPTYGNRSSTPAASSGCGSRSLRCPAPT